MNKLHLKNAITTLEMLREKCCKELSASTLAEFDGAIEQLRQCLDSREAEVFFNAELTHQILSLMILGMKVTPNISKWILSVIEALEQMINNVQ